MTPALRDRSTGTRVAYAALLCAAAAAAQWMLLPFTQGRIPFMFFLAALAVATIFIGRRYAVAVLVVGIANGVMMLEPIGSPYVLLGEDRATVIAFAVFGTLLVYLGDRVVRATRRAMEAERSLSIAQEDTGVGLFEIDLKQRTLFASPSLIKLFGQRPRSTDRGEIIALDEWNARMPPEEVQASGALLRRELARGASSYEREHKLVIGDGRERWFQSKVRIDRDEHGRARCLRGASLDITERKHAAALLGRARAELMQQVADLQRLHGLSARAIELDDLHAQLRLILQTLMEVNHASKGVVSMVDPRERRLRIEIEIGFDQSVRQLDWLTRGKLACGQAFGDKRRVLINDISADAGFVVEREEAENLGVRALHCTPMVSADGEVCGVLSLFFTDVHAPSERELRLADICASQATVFVERARAQVVARESDQRFRLALDSSAVPFSLLAAVRDASGCIHDFRWTYANSATANVLHTHAEALIGQHLRAVLPGAWESADMLGQLVAVAERGEQRQFEMEVNSGPVDGWFHVMASPLQGAVAVWFADITQRKRDAQALQEADRRKDEFLATLAHELRNPLAPIRQAVTISRAPGANEAQRRWSHDVIERQVHQMALLLDDLLDVSRITRGKLHIRTAPALLSDIVDSAVETARPLIDARAHRLLVQIPPRLQFEADALRISQIIGNFLVNAGKYTDPGGTIRLSAEHSDHELAISVSDNGVGIPSDKMNEIFEMFAQVRSAYDRTAGGLGIGLALAKGLAALHGGRIEADSGGPGRGSRFTLRLPVRVTIAPESKGSGHETGRNRILRRILVADDNRDAAETLAEFLRLEGHAVEVAYDGLQALAGIKSFSPEVALLDIGMPGLSGNEVARRARTTDAGRNTALVAITGWGQDKDRALAFASGFEHHLTKPVDLGRLRKLLESL